MAYQIDFKRPMVDILCGDTFLVYSVDELTSKERLVDTEIK